MSDIKFEGQSVVIEGDATISRTPDLMLDEASRRRNRTGSRRALVHDFEDGLTLNWDRDYPGGVTVHGARLLNGFRSLLTIASGSVKVIGRWFMLDDPAKRVNETSFRRALVHDNGDKLTINYRGDYPGGVEIWGPVQFRQARDKYFVDISDIRVAIESHKTTTKKLEELEAAVKALSADLPRTARTARATRKTTAPSKSSVPRKPGRATS